MQGVLGDDFHDVPFDSIRYEGSARLIVPSMEIVAPSLAALIALTTLGSWAMTRNQVVQVRALSMTRVERKWKCAVIRANHNP